MNLRRSLFPLGRWLEPLLAVAVIASLVWSAIHLSLYGYLPQPFFYEPQDTWMDWFNTAFWAHNPGAYDAWGTIYPPLSFVVLRFLTDGSCYVGSTGGLPTRDCDWLGAVTLHLIFLLNIVLTWKTFRKIDRRTALPRTVALSIGLPMLFALERGNLILLCYTFVLLAFGPLVKSARLRWLFAALAINLKVYLIGSLFAQLLRRRWRWFEGAAITTVLVYLVSFAMLGAGTPGEIYRNIIDYSSGFVAASFLDLWYPTTYKPLISLIENDNFPVVRMAGSQLVEIVAVILPLITYAVQGTIVAAAAAAWLRPEVIPTTRLVGLAIALALITAESGGYTQILLFLFLFMEPWRGFGRKWAIVTAYLLCIVGDIPIDEVPQVAGYSYLGGREVITTYFVGALPFVRPLLIMSIPFSLSLVTIREVWVDLRRQGWRTRWRFRRDFPLLTGPGAAMPPLPGSASVRSA